MYKTASPYIKELLKGEIKWNPFSEATLKRAIREDKMIFVHIGNISDIEKRNASYALFSNPEVIKTINRNFIAVALDTEDVPEAHLIGMDLLLINEQKISNHINIFSLPGIKPVISFSSLDAGDFMHIARNLTESFKNQRGKLELAAEYLTERLKSSSIVTHKEPKKKISAKLLHAYIRSWSTRFLDKETKMNRSPYSITTRNLTFILEYAHEYSIAEYLEYIEETLQHVYYSPQFDPIDGGLFSQAEDYTFKQPYYEKSIYENANAVILFATAYKYFKKRIYKEAAQRITHFLQSRMNLNGKGYATYLTLSKTASESKYYKYSLKELKKVFPDRWKSIAAALGMDNKRGENEYQTISNTRKYWEITYEELDILKKIRDSRSSEIIYDKRVMTGYNCKTATAFCYMAKISPKGEKEEYLGLAREIMENILQRQKNSSIKLYKYITSSNVEYSNSDLYDYALFLNSILNYYILTKDEKYISLAKTYTAYIIFNHYQPAKGMFSKTARYESKIPVRRAPVIDYNTFSSNAIMADNLLLLYKITGGNEVYLKAFKQQIYNIEPQLIGSGPFMSSWGMQVLYYLSGHTTLETE